MPRPPGAPGSRPAKLTVAVFFSDDYDGTVESEPAKFSDAVTGRIDGTTVTGTYQASAQFTYQGTAYTCSSGQRTWTASKLP